MNNEIRNELLNLMYMSKSTNDEDKEFYLKQTLERFQYDLEDKVKELEYQLNQAKSNLEMLDYVRKELGIGNKKD